MLGSSLSADQTLCFRLCLLDAMQRALFSFTRFCRDHLGLMQHLIKRCVDVNEDLSIQLYGLKVGCTFTLSRDVYWIISLLRHSALTSVGAVDARCAVVLLDAVKVCVQCHVLGP